jgi:hypothetical protein
MLADNPNNPDLIMPSQEASLRPSPSPGALTLSGKIRLLKKGMLARVKIDQ